MAKITKFKGAKTFAAILGLSVAAASIGAIVSCGSDDSSSKITIRVEPDSMKVYQKAVEIYNSQGGHQYPIQLIENKNGVDIMKDIETLGATKPEIPDLIYCAGDQVQKLVDNAHAFAGFNSVQDFVNGSNGQPIITSAVYGDNINDHFTTGSINGKTYTIQHNKEAIFGYAKGEFVTMLQNNPDMSLKEILDWALDPSHITNSFAAYDAGNAWFNLGLLGSYVGAEAKLPANNIPSLDVGKTLFNPDGKVTNINALADPSSSTIPTGSSIINSVQAATGLQKGVNFVADYIKKMYDADFSALLGKGATGDWVMTKYADTLKILWKKAPNGFIFDGTWSSAAYEGATPVVIKNVDTNVPWATPNNGGWQFGINVRNENNPQKMDDIKSFINILLSNQEIITQILKDAGKVTYSNVSPTTDTAAAKVTNQVNSMAGVVTVGNPQFGDVYYAAFPEGLSSDSAKAAYKDKSVTGDAYHKQIYSSLQTSFKSSIGTLGQSK